MESNSHYSGRLQSAVESVISKSPVKFYEFFTNHDFFDVADKNNSLTEEQRNQVPSVNQYRYSQFSTAIADMFEFVLGGDDGLLSKYVQEIIDKLDTRASMNTAQLNVLGATLTAVPGLDRVQSAMKSAESQTAAAMGSSAYNPDLIPPITLGMPGLPAGVANTFIPGFFQPNWTFLYDRETIKNGKFYLGEGGLRIGANIPITGMSELYLKKIFAVVGVNKSLSPVGDLAGGVTAEEFKTILDASNASDFSPYIKNGAKAGFTLGELQMRNSFNRYIDNALWSPLKNPNDWVNAHWGAIANNACPEPVKTAIASYIWNNGFSLEPGKSDDAAIISYLVTIGVYYLIGYQYNIRLAPVPNYDKDATGAVVSTSFITAKQTGIDGVDIIGKDVVGVVTDKSIANRYFTWVADILLRSTNLASDPALGIKLRKRRIDEANLIYSYVGLPVIEYGVAISDLPYEHQQAGLQERNFQAIARDGFKVYRYLNTGVAGGEGSKGELMTPVNVKAKIIFGGNANPEPVSDDILTYIKSLMDKAGVSSGTITSTTRSAVDQVRAMYGNLANGVEIRYGPAGRAVTGTFYSNKGKSSSVIQSEMVSTCKQQPEYRVSRHCADFKEKLVLDIGPNSITPQYARSAFQSLLRAAEQDSSSPVKKLLTPEDNDPAIHIEFDPNASFTTHPNRKLPAVEFKLINPTLIKMAGWNAPLSADTINKAAEKNDLDVTV